MFEQLQGELPLQLQLLLVGVLAGDAPFSDRELVAVVPVVVPERGVRHLDAVVFPDDLGPLHGAHELPFLHPLVRQQLTGYLVQLLGPPWPLFQRVENLVVILLVPVKDAAGIVEAAEACFGCRFSYGGSSVSPQQPPSRLDPLGRLVQSRTDVLEQLAQEVVPPLPTKRIPHQLGLLLSFPLLPHFLRCQRPALFSLDVFCEEGEGPPDANAGGASAQMNLGQAVVALLEVDRRPVPGCSDHRFCSI